MTVYKIAEKQPDKDQYCFIKNKDQWIFCIYQGTKEEPDKWGFFRNPASFNLEGIQEWQPAFIKLSNATIDLVARKAFYDLSDIQNDEGHSFWEAFKNTVGEANDNSNGSNGNSQDRGIDISSEIPVLRPDSIESVK